MTGLSTQTLMVLVQVLSRELKRLQAARDAAREPAYSDYEEIILAVSQAEEEVRQAYAVASARCDNLPSLAALLRMG